MRWAKSGKANTSIEITEEFAQAVAEQYFLCARDRRKMGFALGIEASLDEFYLHDPRIRNEINERAKSMRQGKLYSHEEHVNKIKEIRDLAMSGIIREDPETGIEVVIEAPDLNLALKAEIALGKASGLYEDLGAPPEEEATTVAAHKLTNDEIRARLSKIQQKALPSQDDLKPIKTVNDEAF